MVLLIAAFAYVYLLPFARVCTVLIVCFNLFDLSLLLTVVTLWYLLVSGLFVIVLLYTFVLMICCELCWVVYIEFDIVLWGVFSGFLLLVLWVIAYSFLLLFCFGLLAFAFVWRDCCSVTKMCVGLLFYFVDCWF